MASRWKSFKHEAEWWLKDAWAWISEGAMWFVIFLALGLGGFRCEGW